jgi:hypothetical protein
MKTKQENQKISRPIFLFVNIGPGLARLIKLTYTGPGLAKFSKNRPVQGSSLRIAVSLLGAQSIAYIKNIP